MREWANIVIQTPEFHFVIEVKRNLNPEKFRGILRRALRGRVSSLKEDFGQFAFNLCGIVRYECGGQKTDALRFASDMKQPWRYVITPEKIVRLDVWHTDKLVFCGPFFKFTKRIPRSLRKTVKKEKPSRRRPNAHRYSPVPT